MPSTEDIPTTISEEALSTSYHFHEHPDDCQRRDPSKRGRMQGKNAVTHEKEIRL